MLDDQFQYEVEEEEEEEYRSERTAYLPCLDLRVLWIRDKVIKFLGLEGFEHLFDELLRKNNGVYEKKLLDFLVTDLDGSNTNLALKQVFFYVTHVDEAVQEEITVWEEKAEIQEESDDEVIVTKRRKSKKGKKKKGEETTPSLPVEDPFVESEKSRTGEYDSFAFDNMEGEEEEEEEDEGNMYGYKYGAGALRKEREKPGMPDFVPPPGEESKYVLRKKLVEVMRRVPILSMMHGDITVDPGKENELKNVNIFYFVRSRDEGIPELSSYEECIATIPSYLVVGSMNGKFLNSLERLLTQVFKPLVESQFAGEVRSKVDIDRKPKTTTWHGNPANMVHRRGSSFKRPSVFRGATIEEDEESLPRKDDERSPEGGLTHIKRDILIYLDQLAESVEWSMEHIDIEGNALLTMPEESSLDSVDRMEEIVSFWAKQVVQVIDEYSKRSALGKGPLAEHRHWHDLETVLSMLIEQLKSPKALNTLELLNKASSEVASDFQYTKNELWKRYTQARENNQFLVTVFRYFKYMTDSDSFRAIRESLASLMEALRMIWILSSYYSQEERMQALMEKISWQLCDNVKRNLPICKLFEMPLERALELCEDACEMMREWRSVYLKTRSEIEACGKGARWEFNRKTLFAATDYIGTVASDLSSMVKVLIDFRKIFGPELKAVMHDPAQIDALSQKVDVLVQPIRKIDYDPLNEFNRDNWAATVSSFQEELATLEEEAKNFIDDCFDLLTSAQDGLTFLQQFAKPVMLRSIEDKLSGKYHVIVQRFSQEISEIEDCYNTAKGDPPLLKYQPSASGSIFWLRKLFHRLKKPVLLFRDLPELKGSDSKASTFAQYLALAKQMKSYEEEKYGEWHVKAEITITAAIRRSLLSVVQPKVTDTRVVETTRRRVRNKLGALRMPLNVRQRNSNELRIGDGDHTLFACNTRFRLNFDWELFRVVREAELMEQLGFQLGKNGSAVREIAVRSNSLRSDVEATESMIDKYNGILDQLEPADVELLRCALFEIEKCIEPGVTRFNWNSLNIGDYAKRCDNLLKGLSSQSLQINRIKRDLDEKILIEIGKARLYPKDTDASRELPTCKELFDQIKKTRYESLGKMSKAYADLTPMLTKLESMVKGTSTGRSSFMRLFYEKYENKVFDALARCIGTNLAQLNDMLLCRRVVSFQVDALLVASEVQLRPTPSEIYAMIMQSAKDLLDLSKAFPRWMNGTCLRCEAETHYSFYEDLLSLRMLNDLVYSIEESARKVCMDCSKYIVRWKRRSSVWSFEKRLVCERFAAKKPTLLQYDEKLSYYTLMLEELQDMAVYYDLGSIRINLKPLLNGIAKHANQWKQTYADCLLNDVLVEMREFRSKIEQLRNEIELVVTGLERFTLIMQAISDIRRMAVQAEVQYASYREMFLLLRAHNVDFEEIDEKIALQLQSDWESLYLGAMYRMTTLETTSDRFAELTEQAISNFLEEMTSFTEDFEKNGPASVGDDLELALTIMDSYGKRIDQLDERKSSLVRSELLFDLTPADYSSLTKMKKEMEGMQRLLDLYKRQKNARSDWARTLWADLNPQQLLDGMDAFIKELRSFPRAVRKLEMGQSLDAIMKNFKNSVPLFVELKNEAMRERHWMELMKQTGRFFDMTPDRFTLENMFAMELGKYEEIAQTIVRNATRELAIERGLKELSDTWKAMELILVKHWKGAEDRGSILGPINDLIQALDDDMLNVHSMAASRYIGPFAETVKQWETTMHITSEVLELWTEFQRKWLYLEGIFVGGDIRLQLPEEAKKFDDIDKMYRKIMLDASKRLNVIECCGIPARGDEFKAMIANLERCQKNLADYLRSKRNLFPRFIFLSDDELLGILSKSEPTVIQEHIGKIFDNLAKIEITQDQSNRSVATALISNEAEFMSYRNPVLLAGKIENWMSNVLAEMKSSNRYWTKKAIYDFAKIDKASRIRWILQYEGMMILAADQVWWTAEVEETFRRISIGKSQAMKEYLQELNDRLENVVSLMGKDNLRANDRKKFDTLLTIDVHLRDIIENFVRDNITNGTLFEWESQLKFYWVHDLDNIWVHQCTGSFEYGYEYMGLNGRLVITPLTDRIYLTFTQALSMHLGGAPAGPAGTGKTETTKDLAKALGLLCLVTNCGESMDYLAIGRILSGLAQCGAWGCFDEFNRIDVSVLSVISTQLHAIRTALLSKAKRFMLEGADAGEDDLVLDRKVGVFITMNPGYAGRSELPESVKSLFRPVTCVVPDKEIICQIRLFSSGYLSAKILAKKIIVLYKLAEDQLSKQVHYDFGLRSLKSVLSMADNLMRSGGTEDGSGGQQSHENVLLTRALRDINLPKLITDDVSLFNGLMTDLFPDLKSTFSKNPYPELMKAVKRVLKTRRYIQIQEQIDKIIQLFQAMITRHSCMVVGPTTSGKTIIIETLCEAQTQLTQPTEIFVLNPKACTVNELYGTLDPISRDWNDGIFSKIFRTVNRPRGADEKSSYIVFDGDVDALWIENMNSLMDDNKLLTLANQERIKLRDNCKLLFEVGDLRYASPATVSRAGMVYVDLSTLGYQAYMDRWIESREHKNDESLLNDLCTKYVHGAIQLIQEGIFGSRYTSPLKTVVPQTALNMVSQLCFTMDGLCVLVEVQLNKEREAEKEKEKEKEKEEKDKPVEAEIDPSNVLIDKMSREEIFEAIYILSCYFSFGAALTTPSSKRTFDEYMKTTSGFMLVEETVDNPASIRCLPTKGKTLFEYTLDLETKIWIHWRKLLPAYVHDKELARRGKTFVPTPDTIRTLWFLDLMQKRNRPILLIGERATAKSAIAQQFLNHLSSTESNHIRLSLSFSPRTTSMDVQANLESNLEKRTRDVYGPPAGKSLIFFIDDVNMPTIDTYGTQQPIAFLKFLMERSAFYDRSKDLNLKNVKDIYYIAAMGEPGTGRNEVDPRFVSLFSVYNVSTLSIPSLQTIYASILRGHLSTSSFPTQVQDIASKIISLTLKLYQFISSKFLPTPSKFHYAFDTRDLSRIVAGMLQSEPEDFSTAKQFLRLWRNEFTRVICDRLINEEDSTLLREEVEKAISAVTWPGQSETVAYALRDPLLFGDLKNASPDSDIPPEQESRSYTDLLDYEAVYNLFMEILEDYNENNTNKIRMVLFNDALEHLVRVHRVIRMERGHTLLVGMAGSGKRSIVKLAAYAAKCGVFEISLRLKYNEQSFREDMKKLFWLVGVDKKKTLFFFSESHIVDETFLEMVNNILTSGLIPGLFSDEEKDAIVASWRESSREASSREAAWSCFERSCTDNLRVALSMSPSGDKLRNRCRDYPGLLNCTTIDWMFSWPEQALLAVGSVRLREQSGQVPEEMRDLIVKHAVHVHLSVGEYSKEYMRKLRRFNYATPKHYLDFVNTYMDLLTVGRDYAKFRCDRLSGGLERIAEASVTLNELNAALAVQRLKVAEQTRNCEELMRGIEEGTEVALGKREASMEKRREIEEQKKIIGREEREAKGVLAEAEPILDAARMALSELEKSDITEIRSFATPPDAVRIVTECVAILCNVKDVSWKGAKGMMADPSFLRILQEMKVEKITLKQQQAVKAHLKKSDKLDQMANISKAGYGLYKFVLAVLGYCTVYREVKPKMERVEQLAYESARAQKLLEKEESELRRVETEIGSLSEKYEAALTERQALQEETDVLQRRLIAADKLIGGLASENDRWRVDLASLRQGVDKIIGDSLLSASFLTYAGPFTASFRNIMIYHDWKKSIADNGIPYSHNYRIEGQLSNDVEASAWNSEGLPPDDLSIQNAILTLKSSRSPVCIDPQQQAVNWIRRRERSSNLKILSFSDSDFLKQVELAIRYGTPVLFQDIEEIDPILENVLAKNIQKAPGGRQFVMLGEKEIDYDPKFRIYLTTKIANPSFDPTFYAKAQIINYTVTDLGLEDQLLSVLVRTERPDIEEQRESLIAETSEHKKLLEDLEDSLLREISSNVGNMLDNFELIATLERTKASASQVTTKLFLAQVTAKDLNKLRDNYRLVARRAAALFFVLADMAILGSMYQFSLESYLQVFVRSLRKALPDPTLAKRLANILPVMTSNVYDYGCLAIFQRHKLLYSFQICRRLELQMQQQKQGEKEDTLLVELHRRQLHFFAKGDVSQVENVESLNSANPTTWVSSTSWADLVKLSNDFPNKFSELPNQLKDSNDQWKAWYESDSPEEIDYPCGYSQTLNAFEKLMLIRCFRVDRVCCAVMRYIDEKMGERYVLPAQISFDTIYEQSSAVMPVIFILSPGADPSAELVKLADKYDCGGGKFRYLSLGQGQEKLALELLETALARGQWLLLQNCHLLLPFTRLLDKYLENIQNPHPDFRLWLTTDPIDNFPIGILQRSLKIVTEPPSGLKLNLRNTYFRMSSDLLEQCEHPAYKDLIYTLAFYHAVLQERKKYGKVGWNVSYDFNESDFSVCSNILETYLKKALQQQQQESAWIIPWKSIKYLIGEVMYGGRVVDFYDRRVSRIYMDEYFGDFAFDTLRTFHFFQDPDIDYVIPPQGNRDDYIKYIDDLPLIDRPEVFGLHSNAEIAYFTRSARNMWTDLLQLQPQTDTAVEGSTGEEGSRDNKDKFIENMAKDLLDKLPRKYNIKRLRKNFAPSIPPTTVVLIQELGRVNQLSSVMRRTLMQLRKAIAGEIGMDAELEEISISLFNGSLPKVWAKYAPANKKNLAGWAVHFQKRVAQYSNWSSSGEPAVIWLSGLHIPETYLAALVQVACRKNDWPLDRSVISTTVTHFTNVDEIEEKPQQGCYVHGLYLEGARWDMEKHCLERSHPKILIEQLPILKVTPIESHRLRLQNTIKTPVYTTLDRNNAMGVGIVFEADLAATGHVSHWILQGVCLILNTD